jgi:hypothetical protein
MALIFFAVTSLLSSAVDSRTQNGSETCSGRLYDHSRFEFSDLSFFLPASA